MSNRYMRKPYRCNVCFLPLNTKGQAQRHWFAAHEHASADTRPEGGDSTKIEAPSTSGAVPHEDAADAQ